MMASPPRCSLVPLLGTRLVPVNRIVVWSEGSGRIQVDAPMRMFPLPNGPAPRALDAGDLIQVVHPGRDCSESGLGARNRVHTDIVALERLHEGLGEAIALRALDRSEAGIQVQRESDVDGLGRRV